MKLEIDNHIKQNMFCGYVCEKDSMFVCVTADAELNIPKTCQ